MLVLVLKDQNAVFVLGDAVFVLVLAAEGLSPCPGPRTIVLGHVLDAGN